MQALILAAGQGTRLRGVVGAETPKCMLNFMGDSLIRHCVSKLASAGISRVVIVVGYEAAQVREHLGTECFGLPIHYVVSPNFATTNNVVSLLAAEKYLVEEDTILLESDLVFDVGLVQALVADPRPELTVVDRYELWMDGSAIKCDAQGDVSGFYAKEHVLNSPSDEQFLKTVNIYRFGRDFSARCLVPQLKAYLEQDLAHLQHYYEQVIDVIVRGQLWRMGAHVLNRTRWYEIDDGEDYECAKLLFSNVRERYSGLRARGGGYWRFSGIKAVSSPSGANWPPTWMLDELRWAASAMLSAAPSEMAVQDELASAALRQEPGTVAVVSSEIVNSVENVFLVGPDDLRGAGLTRLSEYLASRTGQASAIVRLDSLYGLKGLDLKLFVSRDRDRIEQIVADRHFGLDSVAEYALQVAGKHEKRLFAEVMKTLSLRDHLATTLENIKGLTVLKSVDYSVWCAVDGPEGSTTRLALALLDRFGVYIHQDVEAQVVQIAVMSEQDLRVLVDRITAILTDWGV